MVLDFVFAVGVGQLTMFHIWLRMNNLKTFDYIMNKKKQEQALTQRGSSSRLNLKKLDEEGNNDIPNDFELNNSHNLLLSPSKLEENKEGKSSL